MAWLLVITVAVCLLVVDLSAGQPMITTRPQSIDTTQGANVTFPCGVSNLVGNQYVAWYTGGGMPITDYGTVILTSGRPYKVEVGPSDDGEVYFNLMLNNIQNTEQPTFRCRILEPERGDTGIPTEIDVTSVRLTIEYFPAEEYPTCTPTGNLTLIEGKEREFICESELGRPSVDIAWKRGDIPLTEPVPRVSWDTETISLIYNFEGNRADQGAVFKCRIINEVEFPGMERICISGSLNVLYPPDDVSITQIPEGDYTAFQCNAGGKPPPTFSWSFNTPLSNSSYDISDDGQLLTQLDFFTCNTADIIVTCEASNLQGTFTTNTTLCEVPICSPNNTTFDALDGEIRTLTCIVDESVDELGWDQNDLTTGDEYQLDDPAMDKDGVELQWVVYKRQTNSLFTCGVSSSCLSAQHRSEGYCHPGPLNEVFFPPENANGNPMDFIYIWETNSELDSSMFEITDLNQNLQIKGNILSETQDIRVTCSVTNEIGSNETI